MKKLLIVVIIISAGLTGLIVYGQRKWDFQSRFTVIELKSPVTISSFDPSTKQGVIITVPDNLLVDTVSGRGSFMASVLAKAGQEWGDAWSAESLADYLGITYTGIAGKLSLTDRFLWWFNGRKVSWEKIALAETSLVTELKDPDGIVVLRLAEHWPERAEDWFSSTNLAREKINVNIVNSTDVPGLGAHAARIIENAGVRVVAVSNSQTKFDKCRIESSEAEFKSLTGRWLQSQYKCDEVIKNDKPGEIILTIGSDYKKWRMGD